MPLRSPGQVGRVLALGDHALGALQPGWASSGPPSRRQVDGLSTSCSSGRGARPAGSSSRRSSSSASRSKAMNASASAREHADARLGGVDALAKRVEVLPALLVEQHDLAVEHVAALGERELGEVARHRLAAARLQEDLAAVDERERAEAVPLGLVDPAVAERERLAGRASCGRTGGLSGRAIRPWKHNDPRRGSDGGRGGRVLSSCLGRGTSISEREVCVVRRR